jgi:hypothetical protein
MMETLSKHGNGNYSYIDSLYTAQKVLVDEMGANLFTVAKDVKAELQFNTATVSEFRLVGYENRLMNDQDFYDDKKDAGEIGAGHTVTVLYEITPVGSGIPLKYQPEETEQITETEFTDEFNNIDVLPLNTGHIVGEYVNILTPKVSGVTFEFVDENDNLLEIPEFFLKKKQIRLKYTVQSGYSATLPKCEPQETSIVGINEWEENGDKIYIIGITPFDNTKLFITATTIDASGNTITIKDNKLKGKEFKNYYYKTYKYDYKPASKDEIGAVRMFEKPNYDDDIVTQPFCANHVHKHKDYFYINRDNYDEENSYIISAITGFDLINCGSY